MDQVVADHLDQIADICRRFDIQRLDVFGSAATGHLGADSDVDFVVDMEPDVDRYFDLKEELEELLQRPVDLLTVRSIRNPYLLQRIEETKQLIYQR